MLCCFWTLPDSVARLIQPDTSICTEREADKRNCCKLDLNPKSSDRQFRYVRRHFGKRCVLIDFLPAISEAINVWSTWSVRSRRWAPARFFRRVMGKTGRFVLMRLLLFYCNLTIVLKVERLKVAKVHNLNQGKVQRQIQKPHGYNQGEYIPVVFLALLHYR